MSAPEFSVEIFQNEYLASEAREVSVVVSVASEGLPVHAATATGAAEIIIVDCSGSMSAPQAKMFEARDATAAAIDAIRDGVAFAVVAGSHIARSLYPDKDSMAIASPETRADAKRTLRFLRPEGGTAMGSWLRLAHQIFITRDEQLRHAILLTDGMNQSQSVSALDSALELCTGVFSCDCRGVGTDWKVEELRRISTALLGTVDIIPDASGLAADFEAMMAASMAKEVADVKLRVWTPQHAAVRFVKQVAPMIEDLTNRRTQVGPQAGDYPTGAWSADESRDYHIRVDVQPAAVGQEMLAARVSLVQASDAGPLTLGQGLVKAIWTDDEELSTKINRHVASYSAQTELAQAIQDGLEAREKGDVETAETLLGRAVDLARESGNELSSKLLSNVVDIDEETGTVRLKPKIVEADAMALDTKSTKTVRVKNKPYDRAGQEVDSDQ